MNITKIVTNDTSTGILIYFSDGSIINMPRYIYDIAYYTNEKAIKNSVRGKILFYSDLKVIVLLLKRKLLSLILIRGMEQEKD